MAARRRCRLRLLLFKIEVRPRSCRSYHIWRPCINSLTIWSPMNQVQKRQNNVRKARCCPYEFFTISLIQTERSKVRVWLILSSDLIIIHVQPSFIRFLRPGNQRRHFYIFLEPPLSCCGTHFPITTKIFFLLQPNILTYLTYLQNSRSITYLFWWILEHKVLTSYEYHASNWDAGNLKNKKTFINNIFYIDNFNIFFRTLTNIWETLLKSDVLLGQNIVCIDKKSNSGLTDSRGIESFNLRFRKLEILVEKTSCCLE